MPTQAPTFDLDSAARLRAAIGKLARLLRPTKAAIDAGLTPTGASVLLAIARAGPIGLSALAAGEGLNPTMLSRVVGDLCSAKLAKRVSDPVDGRAALIKATADGRRLCERMRRERTDALNAGIGVLSDRERDVLEHVLPVLEKLAEELKGGRP